jgi:kelch-like protein 17 (actinfilin)
MWLTRDNRFSKNSRIICHYQIAGICSLDGLLYVCGGYDGASCLSSMERYDPLTGVWSSCPAMATRRRYCRVSSLGAQYLANSNSNSAKTYTPFSDKCIYSLGGFDSSNYQSSVERFDPRVGRWSPLPSMSSRRSSCGVAALEGSLYCVGGNDGTMCMASAERYNPRRNAWEPVAGMHSRRWNQIICFIFIINLKSQISTSNSILFSFISRKLNTIIFRSTHEVVEIDGYLYALGGNDGSSSLNSVERYEPRLNKWTIVTSMLTRRSSVGAGVLDCCNLEKTLTGSSTKSTV